MNNQVLLYQAEDGSLKTEVPIEHDTVWLTQKQMADLFNKDNRTINEHIQNIYSEKELAPNSTIRKFRIVREEGKRKVSREIDHYNLDIIISVGYRVKSKEGTQYLYPSIEEQAAHLLYFIIKNHPFTDGNKRIGAFIFIWFLQRNRHHLKSTGEAKINDNALVAIALLVAQSDPAQKEIMISLIINLIKDFN